jgi:hypothetical protein
LLEISLISTIGLILGWDNPHLLLENDLNLLAFSAVVLRANLFEGGASAIQAFLAVGTRLVDHLEVNIIMLLSCLSVSVPSNSMPFVLSASSSSIRTHASIPHMWF